MKSHFHMKRLYNSTPVCILRQYLSFILKAIKSRLSRDKFPPITGIKEKIRLQWFEYKIKIADSANFSTI